MAAHRIFPHGDFEQLAPGLWQLTGSLPFPLPRKMTVLRLDNGDLVIHSAIALDDARMAELEKLGTPAWLVVPHPLHTMDTAFFKSRYPSLRVIAPDDARAKLGAVQVDLDPERGMRELGLRHHVVPGMRYSELVLDLDVAGGRALVFTDLLAHGGAPKLLLRMMGPRGAYGVPRIVKLRQVRDKPAVRRFLESVDDGDEIRMLLCAHGAPVIDACREALRTARSSV